MTIALESIWNPRSMSREIRGLLDSNPHLDGKISENSVSIHSDYSSRSENVSSG